MKKRLAISFLTLSFMLLTFMLAGCSQGDSQVSDKKSGRRHQYFDSTKDVSIDSLLTRTYPQNILNEQGALKVSYRDEGTASDGTEGGEKVNTTTFIYVKEGDKIYVNQLIDYDNGWYTHLYYSSDPEDPYVYVDAYSDDLGPTKQAAPMSEEEFKAFLGESLLGYEYYNCTLRSCSDKGGIYQAEVGAVYQQDQTMTKTDHLTIDAASGLVISAKTLVFVNGENVNTMEFTMEYGEGIEIDMSPKEAVLGLN